MRLSGKSAIITGGAKGIGKETAMTFVREGAKVLITDMDLSAGEQTKIELQAIGVAEFMQVNVTKREQVAAMVLTAKDKFGSVDVLVNNAGITIDGFLSKMAEKSWDDVLDVNLKGVFNCTQAVVKEMLQSGSGCILNAASVVGVYGNVGQTNYVATKAGVIGLTKAWAKELGPKGIRVNAVAPGFIVTDMTAKVPEKVLEAMKEKTPLKRLGLPADVAKAYLFLASDDASYINGQILGVDGGLVI